MRAALVKANEVHNKMDQKVIDDAVEALHVEIARQPSEVFVPLAAPHLLRLAPRDTRTRVLLRQVLEKGWMEEALTRAFLVQAGDTPGPHVKWLTEVLDAKDPKVRIRAMGGLSACGAAAAPALPKLREIIKAANPDPNDFRRAYTLTDEVPEHVHANWAILRIEAAMKKE
jgi:hypothetical protein